MVENFAGKWSVSRYQVYTRVSATPPRARRTSEPSTAATRFNLLMVGIGNSATGKTGLRAEFYANSVMYGTPKCSSIVNVINANVSQLCGFLGKSRPDDISIRLSGMLTTDTTDGWHAFTASVGRHAWLRLWVDDHRLIDDWSSETHADPLVTPTLLPNVSLSAGRPVEVRIDLRPRSSWVKLALHWRPWRDVPYAPVPSRLLSPNVSSHQASRRALQQRVSIDWNQWYRHSNVAHVLLPQQVGIDLGFRDVSGSEYRGALLEAPRPGQPPPPPVTMGRHAFDGTFSELDFQPAWPRMNATVRVAAATLPSEVLAADERTRLVLISRSHTSASKAGCREREGRDVVPSCAASQPLTVAVHVLAFWGASATASFNETTQMLAIDAAGMATVHGAFSQPSVRVVHGVGDLVIELALHSTMPLLVCLSTVREACAALGASAQALIEPKSRRHLLALGAEVAKARAAIAAASQRTHAELTRAALAAALRPAASVSASTLSTADSLDAVDAMLSVLGWSATFDPRVSVTLPVSRSFETDFDFVLFDWDGYFGSLMACTRPAADAAGAFEIGISNLIEITRARSVYGQVCPAPDHSLWFGSGLSVWACPRAHGLLRR